MDRSTVLMFPYVLTRRNVCIGLGRLVGAINISLNAAYPNDRSCSLDHCWELGETNAY